MEHRCTERDLMAADLRLTSARNNPWLEEDSCSLWRIGRPPRCCPAWRPVCTSRVEGPRRVSLLGHDAEARSAELPPPSTLARDVVDDHLQPSCKPSLLCCLPGCSPSPILDFYKAKLKTLAARIAENSSSLATFEEAWDSLFARFLQQSSGAGVKVPSPILLQLRSELLQSDRYALLHVIEMTLRQHIRGDLTQQRTAKGTRSDPLVPFSRFVRTCSNNLGDSRADRNRSALGRRRMTLLYRTTWTFGIVALTMNNSRCILTRYRRQS